MNYRTLNDAPNLPPGTTEIWYRSPLAWETRNYADFYPGRTHLLLGTTSLTDLESLFYELQGESWSPEGEARTLIAMSGLRHTSMSWGDVIRYPDGRTFRCELMGFSEIG